MSESPFINNNLKGKDHRLLLGVTGGIASGKSTVAGMFGELGAPVIDFDDLAREVVKPGTPGLRKIAEYFGEQVLRPHGILDRKKLSKIVFGDPLKRKELESITHPFVFEEFTKKVAEIDHKQNAEVIQAVVPLLFELDLKSMFDKVLVVYVKPAQQIKRLIARDKISEPDAARILKAQLPIDEKVKGADFVIDNNGSLAQTKEQVKNLWPLLKKSRG